MNFSLPSYDQTGVKNAAFAVGYSPFVYAALTNIRMTIINLKSFFKWAFFNISFFTFATLKKSDVLNPRWQ